MSEQANPEFSLPPGYQPQAHPQATLILVLGLVSLFCCSVTGPIAWVVGMRALSDIRNARGLVGGRPQVLIGTILGAVMTCFAAFCLAIWLLFFLF